MLALSWAPFQDLTNIILQHFKKIIIESCYTSISCLFLFFFNLFYKFITEFMGPTYGPTYSMINLFISYIEIDKWWARDKKQIFLEIKTNIPQNNNKKMKFSVCIHLSMHAKSPCFLTFIVYHWHRLGRSTDSVYYFASCFCIK